MAKREALGKGISALIPEAEHLDSKTSLFYCPVALIRPNPHQPRKAFDDPSLVELAESVREKGVLTPLLVSKDQDGYVLIAGERRWRAAQMAGLERVPVIVKEASDPEHLELAIVENIHRKDLNPLEEAEAYNRLLALTGLTQEELAKKLGKDRSTITNALRILKLPQEVQAHILKGELSMGHARALAGIPDPLRQRELANLAVQKGLSVRQLEALAKKGAQRKRSPQIEPELLSLIDTLRSILATKVELRPGKKGGRLIVHYSSRQELTRLLELLYALSGNGKEVKFVEP